MHEAADAKEAIALLEKQPEIRLIFTDIDVTGPWMTFSCPPMVRSRWPPVRIIVTSGKRMADYRPSDRSVFLSKPYQLNDVMRKMRHDPTS